MTTDCATFLNRFRQCAPGTALMLDVRNDDEVAHGKLAEAVHIPLPDLPARLSELPRGNTVFVYCRSGARAERAAVLLRAAGFAEVVVAKGGGYEELTKA